MLFTTAAPTSQNLLTSINIRENIGDRSQLNLNRVSNKVGFLLISSHFEYLAHYLNTFRLQGVQIEDWVLHFFADCKQPWLFNHMSESQLSDVCLLLNFAKFIPCRCVSQVAIT